MKAVVDRRTFRVRPWRFEGFGSPLGNWTLKMLLKWKSAKSACEIGVLGVKV